MDKRSFGKIRNAVRSISTRNADEQKLASPSKEHIHDALDYIRKLEVKDKDEAKNYVEAHSDLWELRQKVGEKSWKLFMEVSTEKLGITMQQLRPQLQEIVRSSKDRHEASMRFRDAIFLALLRLSDEVKTDLRIQEAFGKRKEMLEQAILGFNVRNKDANEDIIRDLERIYGIRGEDD